MIIHLLKMVWNRKRTNLLIVLEIFISFLILFYVVASGIYCINNYKLPLGFSPQNVWAISINPQTYNYGPYIIPEPELQEKYRQLLLAVRSFGQVSGMAVAGRVPYTNYDWSRVYHQNGHNFTYQYHEASDRFKDVIKMQVVRGRWFEPADDALNWQPVVVNEEFAHMAFGDEDPLGRLVPQGMLKLRTDGTTKDPYICTDGRVVGVIRGYRENGEYSAPKPFAFFRRSLNKPADDMLSWIVIKIKPGTPRSFEEQLMKTFNGVARDWSFQVMILENMRKSTLRQTETLVLLAAIVAGFLMLMVTFGLLGVLWQSVTQRRSEIGLRRAQGATAADIYRQILGELFFITTFGLIPGVLLVIQFPLLNLITDLKMSVYFYSIAISMILIYILTFICGLYPGWLATRIRPAEALHYE
jgi:putative ABC transport system permease protein